MASKTTPKAQADDKKVQLNQREIEIIAVAFQCISDVKDGIPQVDAKKLAVLGNYASADSARHIWKPVEKKLATMASGAEANGGLLAPGSTKAGRPRKRKNDDAGDSEATPTKKTRGRKSAKAKAKKDVQDDSNDLEDVTSGDFDDGEV